jgi:hypothetical protein
MSATPGMLAERFGAANTQKEDTISDTHRRYRAIKRALLQTLPARPNGHHEKHVNSLAALICGIVGAQHTLM